MDKIPNFIACTYKSQNFAHSQRNFAQSHDRETVTFKHSVRNIHPDANNIFLYQEILFHASNKKNDFTTGGNNTSKPHVSNILEEDDHLSVSY